MSDTRPSEPQADPTAESVPPVHERPEIKSLVEKAAPPLDDQAIPGRMKTGADLPGGGGTHSLELPDAQANTGE